jgi:hypothetical protein
MNRFQSGSDMPKGLWVWPSDSKGQRTTLRKVGASLHLMDALAAIAKSKEGLSNAEIDDAISDSSEWTTLWVVRQLTALGFVEYKVDFFGNPNKYEMTDRGRAALSSITGKPVAKPSPPSPAPPAVAPPKPAAPAPQAAPVPPPPKPS